jgi:hypothetical protein
MKKIAKDDGKRRIAPEDIAKAFGAKIVTEFPPGSRVAMLRRVGDSAFQRPAAKEGEG